MTESSLLIALSASASGSTLAMRLLMELICMATR